MQLTHLCPKQDWFSGNPKTITSDKTNVNILLDTCLEVTLHPLILTYDLLPAVQHLVVVLRRERQQMYRANVYAAHVNTDAITSREKNT